MSTRLAIVLLALSPLPFLISLAGFGYAFETPMGSLLGDAAIFIPLALLVFSKNIILSPACRRLLRWALGRLLLLIPAVGLHFAPASSMKFGHADRIHLDPPPHPMPAEGAAIIRGLSVNGDLMVLRSTLELRRDDPSPYSACDYLQWYFPPSHFADENGNGIDFSLIGPDLLRFKDDRGGYADVKWDGQQFVLAASQSAGQSVSAKSPTAAASGIGKIGDLLLILVPMLAWLLITVFALRYSQETAEPSPSLVLSILAQILGMIVLTFAILSAPATNDEISGGLLVLFMLIAAASSLVGLSILAWHLVQLKFQNPEEI